MANYTAADVKKLRDLTGAGMMDCKKALDEADGDFEKAVEFLRIKGAKDVGKRAGRTAANGIVSHYGTALLELNCETDFVAKTDDFVALGQQLVEYGKSVADTIQEYSARIGEKIVVNRFVVLDGTVAVYLHRKAQDLPPQVGVLVQYSGKSDEAADDDARGIGMQVAAMRPKYLVREEVPAEVVESERRIAEETAKEEGKPEKALPKIIEGRVNSFFKDYVLLEQSSVIDNKKTVKQVAEAAGLQITRFVRFEVGQE
jgi:elongation factor Ts